LKTSGAINPECRASSAYCVRGSTRRAETATRNSVWHGMPAIRRRLLYMIIITALHLSGAPVRIVMRAHSSGLHNACDAVPQRRKQPQTDAGRAEIAHEKDRLGDCVGSVLYMYGTVSTVQRECASHGRPELCRLQGPPLIIDLPVYIELLTRQHGCFA